MRRYLTLSEAEAALNRGKQIEQFLGGYLAYGDPAIRYLVIRSEDERIVANIYEKLEPSHPDFFDVVEFSNVEPDSDPEDLYFGRLADALSSLEVTNAVLPDKFVNQGLVCEEYRDFQKAKNS